jgi:glycosyltransferase involved in cell wall biosynthesis
VRGTAAILSYGPRVRIAHVSDCYLPRLGGIEVQVRALATRQRDAGDDVRVITATPGHDGVRSGLDVVDGLPVHRVAARLPFELPVHPRTGHHVGAILRDDPVDVVHVHAGVVSPFAWSGMRAAVSAGFPVLVTVHSVWGAGARPGFRAADLLTRWSGWGVQVSAVSRVAADRIESVIDQEVLVVPNGIDPAGWRVDPVPGGPDELRVAAVMRLAPRKRAAPLMRVLHEASEALAPDVRLTAVVVGDGPERTRLERYLARTGLAAAVDLPGRLTHEQILAVFGRSDVFVQPSVKESFGLAALEARTAGLPVVARSQTGIGEFVTDGVEGLLAPDDAGLVAALVRLGRDPGLRAGMAAHNRSVEPAQTWPGVLRVVRDAYDAAVLQRATTDAAG